MTESALRVREGHRALGLLFGVLGVAAGAWGVHIASIKVRHGLDDGGLALVLWAVAVGALASMLASGPVIARLGTRQTVRLTGLALCVLLGAALWWPNGPLLVSGLLALGLFISVHDVALNAEGTALERRLGRPVMGRLHGLFSVGAMVGALLCAGLLKLPVDPGWPVVGLCAALALILWAACGRLLDAHPAVQGPVGPAAFVWPRGRLLGIGLLIFAGMLAEGVMMDWTVLFLQEALRWPQERAAVGYAVFVGAMAVGRLGTDRLRARWGDERLLPLASATAAASMAVALWWPHPWVVLPALAGVGLGLAPVVPLLYTAASRVPGSTSAAALAAASAIGYTGFLAGPPLMGAWAQAQSLTSAMWIVALAAALLAFAARRIRPTGPASRSP